MSVTAMSINWYNKGKKHMLQSVDTSSTTFKMLLTTSSYTPDAAAHDFLDDITNECSGSGYSRATLGSVTTTEVSAGLWMLDSADPQFSASGGNIVARYWVLFQDTGVAATSGLICYGLLDNTNSNVTIVDATTLDVLVPSTGWIRWS